MTITLAASLIQAIQDGDQTKVLEILTSPDFDKFSPQEYDQIKKIAEKAAGVYSAWVHRRHQLLSVEGLSKKSIIKYIHSTAH